MLMQVILAEAMGFCFGVRDALRATEQIAQPELVTIRGELVHNPTVIGDLRSRGFQQQTELATAAVPATPLVLITAHGVSDTDRQALLTAGKQVIDTTCPLVRRAHAAACELAAEGRHVVVIGRAGHVEVRGLVGDLPDFTIIGSEAEVEAWGHARLGVVCQTTTPQALAAAVLERIEQLNPDANVRFIDTVCQPTVDRQEALERLLLQVDMVVVVGGRNSNNTARLVDLCRERGTPAFHVESAAELEVDWFAGCETVGLTAGTSTPDDVIDRVAAALRSLTPPLAPGGPWSSAAWCMHFRRNARRQAAIPWETASQLTEAERQAVARSIAVFQLGESGEGRHVLRCAARHAREHNDPHYLPAMRLFIQEEQRHAALLGRFLDEAGLSRLPRDWSDGVFRWLRHQAGLELTINVLVTAEMLAKVYYAALRDATQCEALRVLCGQILRDEVAHVRFQCARIATLQERNPSWLRRVKRGAHAVLYAATTAVVWWTHHRVFNAAGWGTLGFVRRSISALRNTGCGVEQFMDCQRTDRLSPHTPGSP
jgi:4-hydroxy-3-methylbut-2-enyl diphosphate reductase